MLGVFVVPEARQPFERSLLESLIRASFIQDPDSVKTIVDPLFRGYAPLATFSARIDICFAFGLINQDFRRELGIVRRLRNDFAHEPGIISFTTAACDARLQALIGSPNLIPPNAPPEFRELLEETRAEDESGFRRRVYVFKIVTMAGYISGTRQRITEYRDQRPHQPIAQPNPMAEGAQSSGKT